MALKVDFLLKRSSMNTKELFGRFLFAGWVHFTLQGCPKGLLTYMSMKAQILDLVQRGVLVDLPRMNGASPRNVYMATCVREMVDQAFEDTDISLDRYGPCRALLEHFADNKRINFGWRPHEKDSSAHMARIDPEGHYNRYVFDFRSQDNVAGIRVFGCFACKDWFVATRWTLREEVDWPSQATECHQAWVDIFGGPPPDLGRNPNDYLSGNFSLV